MDKIIEHNGKKYRPIKNDSKESSDCSFCDIGDSGDKCGFLSQCKGFHYLKEIKENNMKKSELSFKCVIESLEIESNLKRLLGLNGEKTDGNCFARYYDGYLETVASAKAFSVWPEPIMNSRDAIQLIESIEPDAPEFDIKPFDKVICRCKEKNARWNCDFFNFMERNIIYVVGFHTGTGMQVIKADGNEHLIGTVDTPPGWWECENGKPVWKTK